jgi:hypothetical protein
MTINRYRYFYACAFSVFEGDLVAFVDEMVEHDHAESTVRIYLSCINDVAKAMRAAGIAACDLDETEYAETLDPEEIASGSREQKPALSRWRHYATYADISIRRIGRRQPAASAVISPAMPRTEASAPARN